MQNQPEWSAGNAGWTRGTAALRRGFGSARQNVWMTWERTAAWAMKLTSEHALYAGICIVMVKRYKGEPFVCEDGTRIERGDRIGELHLNNGKVLALTRELGADRAALQTARLARNSLKEIRRELDGRPELAGIKALVGVTILHRGLTHGLGFEQRPLASKRFEKLTSIYLKLLLRFMHPNGLARSERSRLKLTPVMLVCTRGNLARKFGPKPELRQQHEGGSSACESLASG
jgi:hypothetical protein